MGIAKEGDLTLMVAWKEVGGVVSQLPYNPMAGMFLSTSRTYAYWDGTSVGLLGSFSDVDVRTPNRLPGHLV